MEFSKGKDYVIEYKKEKILVKFISKGKGNFEDFFTKGKGDVGDFGNFQRLDEGNSWIIIALSDIKSIRKPTKKDYEIAKQKQVEAQI